MAGLVLSLKPNEKFLVNGALLENGPKRGQIRVEADGVNVLRLSDVIHPDDVNTPIKRVYYNAQLVLSGDMTIDEVEAQVKDGLVDLLKVFAGTEMIKNILKAANAVEHGRYYSVLCALKPLLHIEQELLTLSQHTDQKDQAQHSLAAAG
ncbi:MAG: flagellar biosynthesis repressor FlbT [Acidimicrobiales bacterium]|nr:flagellar biosynthesis repressor FlbT [Hyphomonadaceae bacterium]RZV44769.1 MAG: flagellar biosynthesis repressor FlbT [Acidimicrobiales bacterium]